MRLTSAIKRVLSPKKVEAPPKPKSIEEQMEALSNGWYDKHWALRSVIHDKKQREIGRLEGKLTCAGVRKMDEKKPAEFYICEETFAMLEYLIFNAPKIMDSLLAMRINSLKGQLATAQAKAEKVLRATREATS